MDEESLGWGVVSILDVLVEWLNQGEKTSLHGADGRVHPAVLMDEGFDIYTSSIHAHPIVCIPTKSCDRVFMTIADKPQGSFALLHHINELRNSLDKEEVGYNELIFPMIDYDREFKLDWLKGLYIRGYSITEALQQTKFKMNHIGAHVKSAVAISFVRCMREQPYKIDRPFFVWIERPGVSEPIFAGYMDYEHWKDPATLDL